MLGYDGNALLSPGMEVLAKGVKAVERLILKQDPAAGIAVSLERAEAVVTSQLPAQPFGEALTKAGYPAALQ